MYCAHVTTGLKNTVHGFGSRCTVSIQVPGSKDYKTNVDIMYIRKANLKRESTVMLHGRRKAAAFSVRNSFLIIISPVQTEEPDPAK